MIHKITKQTILDIAKEKGPVLTADFAAGFGVSRQYVSGLMRQLAASGQLIKIGSTRKALYVLPEYIRSHTELLPHRFSKRYKNQHMEEHTVLSEIEKKFLTVRELPEPVKDIFTFAFLEMFNNAVEHSQSENISIEVFLNGKELTFVVDDAGVGVFRNVMKERHLKSEFEAIQDLTKGKTTTMPKQHSGEGIFFTSKAADVFILDSFGYQMIVNNNLADVFMRKVPIIKKGTRVSFKITIESQRHLSDIFKKYTNLKEESDYGFDKTEIRVKLFTMSGIHISRSQARRILHGLEKFKIILFDFDKVPMIGQAFGDEIYRVFHNKYPEIELHEENMNEAVKFMIDRAKTEAKRSLQ
jgi:anti-sigma regulatory factor (Ser/Thr protein kinase)